MAKSKSKKRKAKKQWRHNNMAKSKSKKRKAKKKIVGLPLSEDYQAHGLKYDPSQLAPKKKASKKK